MRATRSAQIRTATSVVSPDRRRRRGAGSAAGDGRSSADDARSNGSALTSAIERPAKVTASASGRSPLPWQSGQGTLRTNRIARSRIRSLLESARTCMTCLRALQNLP